MSNRGRRRRLRPEIVAAIRADLAAGQMGQMEIGKKYKIHHSTVSKIHRNVLGRAPVSEVPAFPRKPRALANPMRSQVEALVAQKFGPTEIAKKLNIPAGRASYYIYGKKPQHFQLEGAHTNGTSAINKNIAIGIAYAETERFISALAERLGVSAAILRPRLSELLGRASFRGASGPAD